MQTWIEPVVSNAVVATLMALLVSLVTRFVRRPQIVYALWLLVLLKLVTPPVVPVHLRVACLEKWMPAAPSACIRPPIDETRPAVVQAIAAQGVCEEDRKTAVSRRACSTFSTALLSQRRAGAAANPTSSQAQTALPNDRVEPGGHMHPRWSIPWLALLTSVWLIGTVAWFALVVSRTVGFTRLLHRAEPASEPLQAETRRLARRLGLREAPRVLVAESRIPPLVWSFGRRPTVLLPADLLTRLTTAQQAAVLAHELAHLRRRDHWMRWLDTPILGLFWWHPVAWWARRRLQHAEEQCCDAWGLWVFPGKAKEYAGALLAVIDFLSEIRPAMSPVVCGFRQTSPLLRRFEMILREGTSHRVSWRTRVALLAVAAVLLPLSPLALGSKGETPPKPNRDREGAATYAAGAHEAAWASPPAAPDVAAPAASAPGGRSAAKRSSPSYVPKSSASSKDSGDSQKASPVILEQRQKVWEAKQRLLEAQAALEYRQRELAHAETETVHQSNKNPHSEQTQKSAALPTALVKRVVPREPVAQPAQPSSSARESLAATRRELLDAKRRLAIEKERRLEAEHRLANHQREVANAEAEVARLEGSDISEALQQRLKEVEAQDKRIRERYNRWIAANREVDAVQKAHEDGSVTLNVLLETQRRAAEAEIQYWDMLSEATSRNDTATRRLNTLITARDRALKTWRQVCRQHEDGRASAAEEAQAREQYFLFQGIVTKAANAIQEEIDPEEGERPVAPRR